MIAYEIPSKRKLLDERLVKHAIPLSAIGVVLAFALMILLFIAKLPFTVLLIFIFVTVFGIMAAGKYIKSHTVILSSRLEFCDDYILYFRKTAVDDVCYRIKSIDKYTVDDDELLIEGDIDIVSGSDKNSAGFCTVEGILDEQTMDLIDAFKDRDYESVLDSVK